MAARKGPYVLRPATVIRLVASDVELVESEARVVVEITAQNDVKVRCNSRGKLGVVAIVGAGTYRGLCFQKCLLMEIGVGRTRPYRPARSIHRRRKWFSPSLEQMARLIPVLSKLMNRIVAKKRGRWKSTKKQEPFWSCQNLARWTNRRGNDVSVFSRWKPMERGVRFSLSFEDRQLVEAAYQAELSGFMGKRGSFDRLHCLLAKMICYKRDSARRSEPDFSKTRACHNIRGLIASSRLPRYLWSAFLLGLKAGNDSVSRYREDLLKVVGYKAESPFPELSYLGQAGAFPKEVFSGNRVRVIRRNHHYIVVELVPAKLLAG